MNFHDFIGLIWFVFVVVYLLEMFIGNILRIFYKMDKYY